MSSKGMKSVLQYTDTVKCQPGGSTKNYDITVMQHHAGCFAAAMTTTHAKPDGKSE